MPVPEKRIQTHIRRLLLSLILVSPTIWALELGPLFRNHAVLQRGEPTYIYGWTDPGKKVEIAFSGKHIKTKADSKGKWKTEIGTHAAGGPHKISVSSGNKKITLRDIYFGDVWLASGQSNMEWKLKWGVNNWQEEVANSNIPKIRYFDVINNYEISPKRKIRNVQWLLANPKVSGDFSAVAWLFGKKAYLDQGVAIGIIDSTWGGTPAEAWTPRRALLTTAYRKEAIEMADTSRTWTALFEEEKKNSKIKSRLMTTREGFLNKKLADPQLDDTEWPTIMLPQDEVHEGITWFRRAFDIENLPSSATQAILDLGISPQAVQVYINNRHIGTKIPEEKAKVFRFNANILNKKNNLISLRALNAWNNKFRLGKKGKFSIDVGNQHVSLEGTWRYSHNQEPQFPKITGHWRKPGALYNAMIHPLIESRIKGVIWYQGESNIGRSKDYHELFTTLIRSWRQRWQQEDLPFLFVQLASMHAPSKTPQESSWAKLREAQTQTLALANTGMAVAIDAGEAYDIHPRNKQIIAQRLWKIAEVLAYKKSQEYSGPTVSSMKVDGNELIVNFDNIADGLIYDEKLVGFELADKSGQYKNASARIDGASVILAADLENPPQSVRYGWADNSLANLYNSEALPAVPFRLGESY